VTTPGQLQAVLDRIGRACDRAGRPRDSVRLVAVTKGQTPERIRRVLLDQGQLALGENRVQEWEAKAPDLADRQIEWHFIGNLQRNKVRFCGDFHLIHSLNSVRLADALQRYGERNDLVFRVLLEANLAGEETKMGAPASQLEQLADHARSLPNVSLEGLMTMAPYGSAPDELHALFASARQWRDTLGLKELSMGMSGDFEIAIEEGATIVRVGSLLFEDDAS
jgi:pyridoxal phosphate enzyme (YggS family)